MQSSGVYLLLGSNLGDRAHNLDTAVSMIGEIAGQVVRRSSVYETAAWGNTRQPDFYNMAVEIQTKLDPSGLLEKILSIEETLGRVRTVKWGERIIDIDILFFGDRIVNEKELTIPHPGIPVRRFALEPMNELAPDLRHPVTGATISELLQKCDDVLPVRRVNAG